MAWVHTPSLVSLLATEASALVLDSPAWQSKPSATLRLTDTARSSSKHAYKKDSWTTLPFGTTSQPSTGNLGVDTWILLLAVSRASLTPPQDSARELMTSAISGRTPLESFGKWDHDTSCWRTYQASLLTGTAEPWSGSFPKRGMTVSGIAYRLRKLERRTSDLGGGVWPTPSAIPYGSNVGGSAGRVGKERPSLTTMAKTGMWPTPKGSPEHYGQPRENHRGDLQAAVLWPSPNVSDATGSRLSKGKDRPDEGGLLKAARMWRTPDSYPMGGTAPIEQRKAGGHSVNLQDQVGGQLNPTWVEWLMGIPIGWTSLNELSKEKYAEWKIMSAVRNDVLSEAVGERQARIDFQEQEILQSRMCGFNGDKRAEQWAKEGPTDLANDGLFLREHGETTTPPYRWQSFEQQPCKPSGVMSELPHRSSHGDRNLGTWWAEEPDIPRVAKGVEHRVSRLKALGNGVVPAVVEEFLNLV